jgi:hypothetical protein
MTEPTPVITGETPASKKRRLFLPIAGVILAVAIGGFVASRAGLDKALVKQQVDNFIVQMKEQGREQGRDIDLTYADLEVAGSFANKHVVMREPVLIVKPVDRAEPQNGEKNAIDSLRITTPSIELYPGVSSMTIKSVQTIDFAGEDAPGKSLLKVTPNAAHEVVFSSDKVGELPYEKVHYQAPSQIDFTYLKEQQAQGVEDQTPTVVPVYETLLLSMAQGGSLTSSMAKDDSGLGSVQVDFRDLVLTPKAAPDGAVRLAEVTGKWSNMLNEKKLNVVSAVIKAGPVTSDNTSFPYLPVMLDVDAMYEGAMPKNAEAVANIQSPESVMTLKNFSLSSKEAELKAMANFTASATDALPVGTANISLTNVPFVLEQLKKYKIMNSATESMVLAVLSKVTGTPTDQLKDANIPIQRERGGALKVGSATFEELFALVLQQALQQKPSGAAGEITEPSTDESSELDAPLVPSLPPEDKPRLAPIPIPDPSVRG